MLHSARLPIWTCIDTYSGIVTDNLLTDLERARNPLGCSENIDPIWGEFVVSESTMFLMFVWCQGW